MQERGATEFTVVNEFAVATVRLIDTAGGQRVEIDAPRLGTRIRLDAFLLEALAARSSEAVARMLDCP